MKTFLFIARYIKYFITAKTEHSAQAPFVYEFITQVINTKQANTDYLEIETLRKKLCKSKESKLLTNNGLGCHLYKLYKALKPPE